MCKVILKIKTKTKKNCSFKQKSWVYCLLSQPWNYIMCLRLCYYLPLISIGNVYVLMLFRHFAIYFYLGKREHRPMLYAIKAHNHRFKQQKLFPIQLKIAGIYHTDIDHNKHRSIAFSWIPNHFSWFIYSFVFFFPLLIVGKRWKSKSVLCSWQNPECIEAYVTLFGFPIYKLP